MLVVCVCVLCEYADYKLVKQKNVGKDSVCVWLPPHSVTHTRKNKRVSERVSPPVVYQPGPLSGV